MTHPQHAFPESGSNDAGRHYARLRHMQGLVERIAGREAAGSDAALDQGARISVAYEQSAPIAQRRFDTLVSEVSAWASSGVDALASTKDPRGQPRAAACRLADEIDQALGEMTRLLRL
jgi:hypothetical protein